ncbi:uncharacterized protein LOC133786034 [Humulus lupulus]|uniref:uncharacterized protein LOC133786034 n=1 Tax=Humulus lupulus TaxID=3486 RepID=UPI002B40FABF|nr:uncharacterized protein LOC133786034 [Humulus lupulus]
MKQVVVNVLCPFCNVVEESIFHSLVQCNFVQEVWSSFLLHVNVGVVGGFRDWFDGLFQRFDKDKLGKVAAVCWAIWGAWNNLVWNQKGTNVDDLVTSAMLCLEQWINAQDRDINVSMELFLPRDGSEHWIRPQASIVKVNVDATIFTDHVCYNYYYLVTRNSDGGLVEAKSVCNLGQIQPEVAETIRMKEALNWIRGQRKMSFIVETIFLGLIQALRSSLQMSSYFGVVIQDCKTLLPSLHNVSLFFVKCSANRVVHYLARASNVISERSFGESTALSEFSDVLLNDISLHQNVHFVSVKRVD